MKREYRKPYLAMESFQLNAAIAASCSSDNKQPIHYGENTCIVGDDPGEQSVEIQTIRSATMDLLTQIQFLSSPDIIAHSIAC